MPLCTKHKQVHPTVYADQCKSPLQPSVVLHMCVNNCMQTQQPPASTQHILDPSNITAYIHVTSTVCTHACSHAYKHVHSFPPAHTQVPIHTCSSAPPFCLSGQLGQPCSQPPHPLRTGLLDCTGSTAGRSGPAHALAPGSHPLRPAPSETP